MLGLRSIFCCIIFVFAYFIKLDEMKPIFVGLYPIPILGGVLRISYQILKNSVSVFELVKYCIVQHLINRRFFIMFDIPNIYRLQNYKTKGIINRLEQMESVCKKMKLKLKLKIAYAKFQKVSNRFLKLNKTIFNVYLIVFVGKLVENSLKMSHNLL